MRKIRHQRNDIERLKGSRKEGGIELIEAWKIALIHLYVDSKTILKRKEDKLHQIETALST